MYIGKCTFAITHIRGRTLNLTFSSECFCVFCDIRNISVRRIPYLGLFGPIAHGSKMVNTFEYR